MTDDDLFAHALQARERAHALYSRFRVGAALLAADGRVFAGCNIENAAYGLSHCAERTAFGCAIAAGVPPGAFARLLVLADTREPVAPCGACRQVMLELGGPALPVVLANLQGARRLVHAGGLLPDAFEAGTLGSAGRD